MWARLKRKAIMSLLKSHLGSSCGSLWVAPLIHDSFLLIFMERLKMHHTLLLLPIFGAIIAPDPPNTYLLHLRSTKTLIATRFCHLKSWNSLNKITALSLGPRGETKSQSLWFTPILSLWIMQKQSCIDINEMYPVISFFCTFLNLSTAVQQDFQIYSLLIAWMHLFQVQI